MLSLPIAIDFRVAPARPQYFIAEQGLAIRGHRGEAMAELRVSVHARQAAQEKFVSDKLDDVLNPIWELSSGSRLARGLSQRQGPGTRDLGPDSQLRPRIMHHSPEVQDEHPYFRAYHPEVRGFCMAPCFAILADEATDVSNQQQLSLCVQFVDSKYPKPGGWEEKRGVPGRREKEGRGEREEKEKGERNMIIFPSFSSL